MAAHNDLGQLGEELVAQRLREVAPVLPGRAADLCFCGIEIEVKTARPSLYNGCTLGYQFSLIREGHSQVKAPVVVLVCVDPDALTVAYFVLPAGSVSKQMKVSIPRHIETYQGKLAAYLERWETIAEVMDEVTV